MLDKNTNIAVGQIYIEDDRDDAIVLFQQHRIEAIVGNQLAVTRIQPNSSEYLMVYEKEKFFEHMMEEKEYEEYLKTDSE